MKIWKVITATLAGLVTVGAYATPIQMDSMTTEFEPLVPQSEYLFDSGSTLPTFMELASLDIEHLPVQSEHLVSTGYTLVADVGGTDHLVSSLSMRSLACSVNTRFSDTSCRPIEEAVSVPEPGTLLLLGAGLILLSLSTRNRRRKI